jgi:hypothetical protein
MAVKCAMVLLIALGMSAASVHAQSVVVGAAIHTTIQRFDGDPSLNRLDGESPGWTVGGGVRLGHWVLRGEASRDSTIRNVQSATLIVSGRSLSIDSELAHDTHEVAALGGYAFDFGKRFEVAALGGVSAVTVHRAFTTNAGQLVLIPPSTVPSSPVTTTLVDRFAAWTTEANLMVHATRHLGVTAGVRAQPISLANDLSGRFIRPFAGVAWQIR